MSINRSGEEEWDIVISGKTPFFKIDLKEIWKYIDLLFLLVRRDFVAFYKQTVLGPVWFFLQPLFTIAVYTFVFGKLAKLSTESLPGPLFYLTGIACWTYFSETVMRVSSVFRDNTSIFSKVYFPRLIVPLSIMISSLVRLVIQLFLLMLLTLVYYLKGENVQLSGNIFLLPIIIIVISFWALSIGLLVSSMTVKFRDLALMLSFAMTLLMYASPVIYPISQVSGTAKFILYLNPMTSLIETFRFFIFGVGEFSPPFFLYTLILVFLSLSTSILLFNKIERKFVDTI